MKRWEGMHYDIGALVATGVALTRVLSAAQGTEWPCETDLFRDLGSAQGVLDGSLGGDPGYVGERGWYSPLLPALVAVASKIFGTPLHVAYATFGPYVNLAAPIAFYAMLAGLFHRKVALAGLLAFLFLGPDHLYTWLHATYSPWLWPCNFAQALFYSTVLACVVAARRQSVGWAALAGLALGLTSLTHVAPALVFAGVLLAVTVQGRASLLPGGRRALSIGGIIAGVGAVVASPFFIGLALRYRGAVKNPAPLNWVAGELAIDRWGDVFTRMLTFRGVLALAGAAALVALHRRKHLVERRAVAGWAIVAVAGLTYGFAGQRFSLPPLLPSWHFHFYLQALESVLFGVGVFAAADLLQRRLKRAKRPRLADDRLTLGALAVVIVVVVLKLPTYVRRPDFTTSRDDALAFSGAPWGELYLWVLRSTQASDVFLPPLDPSLYIRAAGRKVVVMPVLYSSPYVDHAARVRDADAAFDHLLHGRSARFREIAGRYGVRYVVLSVTARQTVASSGDVRRVFDASHPDGYDVYQLVEAGHAPADRH